jgi:hypothetical protein
VSQKTSACRGQRCPLWVKLGHSVMSAQCPVCPKADTAKRFTSTRPNKRDGSFLAVGRRRSLDRSISTDLKKRGRGAGSFRGTSQRVACALHLKFSNLQRYARTEYNPRSDGVAGRTAGVGGSDDVDSGSFGGGVGGGRTSRIEGVFPPAGRAGNAFSTLGGLRPSSGRNPASRAARRRNLKQSKGAIRLAISSIFPVRTDGRIRGGFPYFLS